MINVSGLTLGPVVAFAQLTITLHNFEFYGVTRVMALGLFRNYRSKRNIVIRGGIQNVRFKLWHPPGIGIMGYCMYI